MFSSLLPFVTLALVASSAVVAAPSVDAGLELAKRDKSVTDTVILNYALTLEHLENAFYSSAMEMLDAKAFTDAGYGDDVRNRFVEIGKEEGTHVAFLQKALGKKATKPCEYKFPFTDVPSFVGLAAILEGVGTSAYLGAAADITNKAYLTAAGSILTVEARHAAWIHSVGLSQDPFPNSFDTPLGFSNVYSLAAAFITSCPKKNPALPFKAFPSLTVAGDVKAGSKVTLTYKRKGKKDNYLAVIQGLSTSFIKIAKDNTVTLPSTLEGGQVYGVVVTSKKVTDDDTVAGPFVSFVAA